MQERLEGFCVGRGSRALLQKVSRRQFHRRLWTQLHCGKLVAGVIFFWLRRWYADFEKTFFSEKHFVKAEGGEDSHVTNYERAPGSK